MTISCDYQFLLAHFVQLEIVFSRYSNLYAHAGKNQEVIASSPLLFVCLFVCLFVYYLFIIYLFIYYLFIICLFIYFLFY